MILGKVFSTGETLINKPHLSPIKWLVGKTPPKIKSTSSNILRCISGLQPILMNSSSSKQSTDPVDNVDAFSNHDHVVKWRSRVSATTTRSLLLLLIIDMVTSRIRIVEKVNFLFWYIYSLLFRLMINI